MRAGDTSDTVAFVGSGIARMFYTRRDGKEFNKGFVSAPDFVSALEALITKSPTSLSIQALSPMQLLVAPYSEISKFYDRDMYWQRFGRLVAERVYLKKARREASLLMDSAAERYAAFLEDHRSAFGPSRGLSHCGVSWDYPRSTQQVAPSSRASSWWLAQGSAVLDLDQGASRCLGSHVRHAKSHERQSSSKHLPIQSALQNVARRLDPGVRGFGHWVCGPGTSLSAAISRRPRRSARTTGQALGYQYHGAFPGRSHAVRDCNVVTSQNPFSGADFTRLYLAALLDYRRGARCVAGRLAQVLGRVRLLVQHASPG